MKPRDPELFALTARAVRDAVASVRAVMRGEGFVLDHSQFPHLSWFDSGFPHLSSHAWDKVKSYRDAFRLTAGNSDRIRFADLESFQALENYSLENDRIRRRLAHGPDPKKARERFVRISADLMAEHIMDRFLHTHADDEPTDTLLLPIYLPLEAPVLEDTLSFDILVPVVLTHFPDVENETISEGLSLRKLTDQEHLARWPLGASATESVNGLVLSAATHAFVWSGHEISADEWSQRHTNNIDVLPWEKIDLAFDALRVVTGIGTGFAQVVIDPKGWAEEYLADLPPLIQGPSVRRYPERLENWGWIGNRPKVAIEKLPEITETYLVLSGNAQLQMAARRFSASSLRPKEDDAIVDLCTCLEILLTDDTKTEVLHKLSLRAAAITSDYWPQVPAKAIFDVVKVIYDLRSVLLHGKKSKKNLKVVAWGQAEESTATIARWIAQTVLLWTVRRGGPVKPKDVDYELILTAMTKPATSPGP